MSSLNKVLLMGNLTRDPEVKYLASGTAVAELGLAVNDRYKDSQSGEWKERATFIDVTVWGRTAENCGKYLSKGRPVLIEGRLQLDSWETQQGEKRNKLKVRADSVQFIGSGRSSSGAQSGETHDYPDDSSSASTQSQENYDSAPADGVDEDDLPF